MAGEPLSPSTLPVGPAGPSRSLPGGGRGECLRHRVHRQGFPPAMCTSSVWGDGSEEEPAVPRGVRKGKLKGCSPLSTLPASPYSSYPLEGSEGFGFPGSKALLDGTCQLLPSLQPEMFPAAPGRSSGGRGTDGQVPPALQFPAPRKLGPLAREEAPEQEEWAAVAGGLKVEISLKVLPSALRPCLPSKPAPSALLTCTQ